MSGICCSGSTAVRLISLLPTVDFVLGPKNESLLQMYDRWRGWADPKVCCDYSLHVGVTWWSKQCSEEMEVLVKEKGMFTLPLERKKVDS